MPSKTSSTAAAGKSSSTKTGKKTGKNASSQKDPTLAHYNLLAFDGGKARVQGTYVGRSPPQVAKKVLKQLKRKGIDQKGYCMFLRKVGSQKVSVYVGYSKPLAKPIYAFEALVDDEANPGQKIATVLKSREILKDENDEPLPLKFTHTHSAQVVRVGIYPGGL